MATAASVPAVPSRVSVGGYSAGSIRFDWSYIFLAGLLIAGLMVDGWAHFHGQVDNSFFTPWHFLFYSAFGTVALFTAFHQYRNVRKGHEFTKALPQGYWLSLIGVIIFALGGVGDMIWHTLFGIEGGTEALMSPSHIMLAIGMTLISTGPLRAAWHRPESRGWRALGPAIIGASLFLLLVAFFTSYAHPFITPAAAEFGNNADVVQASDLYVMNADGTGQTRLTHNPELSIGSGVWSPDGTQIVYAGSVEEEEANLYLMDADGSNITQLTDYEEGAYNPVWSPNGAKIAFISDSADQSDLYVINADGSERARLTNTPESEWGASWSPDGTQIAVSQDVGGTLTIVTLNPDSSELTPFMTENNSATPAWSPDGTRIAYTAQSGDSYDIFVADSDGNNVTQLTTHESFDGYPAWSADGNQIAFISWRDDHGEVYAMPATGETDTSPAVNLTQNPAFNHADASFSPDGSHILFTTRTRTGEQQGETAGQDAGVAAILLQAVIISGVVLLLVRRWALPFGTVTILLTVSTAAMAVLSDLSILLPAAVITGLVADVLIWRLKPSVNEGAFHLFGFVVPFVLFALYMLTIQFAIGVVWNIHVWTGAIFISGIVGLLISYLVLPPTPAPQLQAAG